MHEARHWRTGLKLHDGINVEASTTDTRELCWTRTVTTQKYMILQLTRLQGWRTNELKLEKKLVAQATQLSKTRGHRRVCKKLYGYGPHIDLQDTNTTPSLQIARG